MNLTFWSMATRIFLALAGCKIMPETFLTVSVNKLVLKLGFSNVCNIFCKQTKKKRKLLNKRYSKTGCASNKFHHFVGLTLKGLSFRLLVWIFSPRRSDSWINKIQETALRVVNYTKIALFMELHSQDKELTNHERNIQILIKEFFKCIMTEVAGPKCYKKSVILKILQNSLESNCARLRYKYFCDNFAKLSRAPFLYYTSR